MMKCNVGKTDRVIRLTIGSTILVLGIAMHSWLALIGLIPLATGIVRWCPAYAPFGLSTEGKDQESQPQP